MGTVKARTAQAVKILLLRGRWFGLAAGAAIMMGGCDMDASSSNRAEVISGQGSVVIDSALALPGLRRIDREALQLELLVNGTLVDTARDADGRWIAAIEVPQGVQLTLQSSIGLDRLLLARSVQQAPVSLEAVEVQVDIPADSYDSNFDADNDRLSNLFELENDTDPLDSGDPGLEVDEAGIRLSFETPSVLKTVDASIAGQARLEATLNGETIEVVAKGNAYVAEAIVVEGSRVYVEATWFLDNPAALAIAGIRRSDSVTDGMTIDYTSDSYRLRLDDDLDGVENALEVSLQSDPTDAASRPGTPDGPDQTEAPDDEVSEPPPVADDEVASACAVSVFTDGCTTDFDQDGIADSVEGQSSDADEDSMPDWMESATSDMDSDGTSAQFDVNEDDPCSPDASAPACVVISSDSDGDGKTDSEEGDADRDNDGKPDADESAFDDADDDGTPDEEDPDDSDPCIPRATRPFCN